MVLAMPVMKLARIINVKDGSKLTNDAGATKRQPTAAKTSAKAENGSGNSRLSAIYEYNNTLYIAINFRNDHPKVKSCNYVTEISPYQA